MEWCYCQKVSKLMHRFFVNPSQIDGKKILIQGEDFHHLTHVLRVDFGEKFEICDGQGMDYLCEIDHIDKEMLTCKVMLKEESKGEDGPLITLYQGLPKGTKMDEIIQKGVEVGISSFVPYLAHRSVTKIDGKVEKKIGRWEKIAYGAAKQAKRGMIPSVEVPINLKALVESIKEYDVFLVAYENENEQTLRLALDGIKAKGTRLNIGILIGPEGGLTLEEIEALKGNGGKIIGLGHRILRTETAALVLAAGLNFLL